MDYSTVIEWVLVILVFGMYFGMPFIAKQFIDLDKRLKAIKVMNIIYLVFTLALIGFIVYEFFVFDMAADYKVTRVAMIVMSIIMFCYSYFLKQNSWKK